jgi:hypothetical protein
MDDLQEINEFLTIGRTGSSAFTAGSAQGRPSSRSAHSASIVIKRR